MRPTNHVTPVERLDTLFSTGSLGVCTLHDHQASLRHAHSCWLGALTKRFSPTTARLAVEAWLLANLYTQSAKSFSKTFFFLSRTMTDNEVARSLCRHPQERGVRSVVWDRLQDASLPARLDQETASGEYLVFTSTWRHIFQMHRNILFKNISGAIDYI